MCRVSSDEQAKGYSLDVQADLLQDYCKRNEIEVVKVFREDHSARDFNRPEFKNFLRLVKQETIKADLLLFTTWDRFSRNIREALNVIHTLKGLNITPFAVQQPLDLEVPENLLLISMYLALPEVDNTRRSMKIREGIKKAHESGIWCRPAPRGYRNARDAQNKPIIIPDQNANLIRLAFEKIAQGLSQRETRRLLNQKGLKVTRSGMSNMLRNVVYIGKIGITSQGSDKPITIEGLHEGIVSERLFNDVQDILQGKNKRKLQSSNIKHRRELPLRGNLVCPKCTSKMTGSASRSRNGNRYYYYHCNYCHSSRIQSGQADQLIKEVLEELKFKSEIKFLYGEILKSLLKKEDQSIGKSKENVQRKMELLRSKLTRIQDLLSEGKLEYSDYLEMSIRYKDEISKLQESQREEKIETTNLKSDLKQAVNMLSDMKGFYERSDSTGKQKLIGSIFPENLSISENKCRTTRINEVLLRLLMIDKEKGEKKKGYFSEKLEISHLVVPAGVEPATQGFSVLCSTN